MDNIGITEATVSIAKSMEQLVETNQKLLRVCVLALKKYGEKFDDETKDFVDEAIKIIEE